MREFVKLTTEEAISETLRQGPTSAGTILKAADNDTVHLHHLTQKYEVHAKYARALDSDVGAERFKQVVNAKLETFWIGTVYGGGVATERGYKFRTPEEAWDNASHFVERCAEIVSERARAAQGESNG